MKTVNLTPFWFTPTSQKKKRKLKARIKLRSLNGMEFLEVIENCNQVKGKLVPNARGRRLIWQAGILDWENVFEGDEKLKFSVLAIEKLDFQTLMEVSNEIFKRSEMSGEARKN